MKLQVQQEIVNVKTRGSSLYRSLFLGILKKIHQNATILVGDQNAAVIQKHHKLGMRTCHCRIGPVAYLLCGYGTVTARVYFILFYFLLFCFVSTKLLLTYVHLLGWLSLTRVHIVNISTTY